MPYSSSPTFPQESGIVLEWLARLRWLAVTGQTMATIIAVGMLKLSLPMPRIVAVIALTGISNIILQFWKFNRVPAWLVPGVLLLDVLLLTALLLCTGGPS